MSLIIVLALVIITTVTRNTFAHPSNVSYSILAPKVFRPGSAYNLIITCYNADADVTMTFRLQSSDNYTLVEKEEVIVNGVTKSVSIEIPDHVPVKSSSYELIAIGQGGLTFSRTHSVTVNRKTLLLFVQTDKAMYKPGQTVLFRVIAVYPDLKPYKDLMDIAIYDLAGNRIMQWLKQKNDTGVIARHLKLSDQTPLGDWKITVTAGENSFTKIFNVAEYVLPKFEVTVTLPTFYLVNLNRHENQKDLRVSISAKYTYGQMVKGRATVSFELSNWRRMVHFYRQTTDDYPKKMMNVELKSGKADIHLSIKDLLDLVPNTDNKRIELSDSTIIVSANVEEAVTGIVLNGNGSVPCKSTKHTLNFLDISPSNFKPGLLYTGFLHLTKADGTPPDPDEIKLPNGEYPSIALSATLYERDKTNASRYHWPEIITNKVFSVPTTASGYMKFSLVINSNIFRVHLEASFNETVTNQIVTAHKTISAFKSRDGQVLQVSFDDQHGVIKAPVEAKFSVITTEEITTFQYGIMSKGNILLTENVVGSLSNNHTFSILITKDLAVKLAPSARVIVWLFTEAGEIVTDSTEVSVSNVFSNEVTLSFDHESTKPSHNVSLTVNANSGSYVGLLAVDQSVLLLKGGNDITQDMVLHELKEFSGTVQSPFDHYDGIALRQKRWVWWPIFIDGSDSKMIFDKSGLLVLTDAVIFSDPDTYRFPIMYDDAIEAAMVPRGDVLQEKMDTFSVQTSGNVEDSSIPRVNFPETWLWTDAITGSNGSVTLEATVPDTITSWIASAFAVSDVTGLGVASSSAKLTVFKKFFISPNLPYSIIRGEEFALQVTVFNYLSVDLDVLITLEESEYFTVHNTSKLTKVVMSDDAASVYFWIVAKSLGQIPIHITAKSSVAGDAMKVMLLVKPEGVQQQYSASVFVQLSSSGPMYNNTLYVSLPPEDILVPGSEYIEVTVIGDVMGPSVKGLDSLLQMPCGCGEQNMLNFAPDVYIVKYLSISNQLTADLESKALGFMNAGYQRELTYQRHDGSFSAFGNSDKEGSVWLSAFVIKCFHQAILYISIDETKIAQTMSWIIRNQALDGSFNEPPLGRVLHTDMQGGSSKGLSMTAYVLNALLENIDNKKFDSNTLMKSIKSAQSYLEDHVSEMASDPYALSIMSYALARANSSRVDDVLQMLEALAKTKAGMKYWKKMSDAKDTSEKLSWRPPYTQARSVNIEMTSYVLLTYCYRKDLSNSFPIAKWIIAQRNANGGFSSTQDTVMALEALSEFAAMIAGPSNGHSLEVTLKAADVSHTFLPINAQTAILLQSFQLPSNAAEVFITAAGQGSALVQLNVLYNVKQTSDNSGIVLKINTAQQGNAVIVDSCGRWTKTGSSGMVVMEVNQLTGFKASNTNELKNQANNIIKRVENTDDKVVLYFDELKSDETCIRIIAEKIFPVSHIQDATVKVYPYYDPSGTRTVFYKAPEAFSLNSVCDECPQCCGLEPRKRQWNGSTYLKPITWIALGSLFLSICW